MKEYHLELSLTEDDLNKELHDRSILFGINNEAISSIVNGLGKEGFPIVIAKGKPPKNGRDGTVEFHWPTSENANTNQSSTTINYREVLQIPSVQEGDKLLTITDPTPGEDGMTVLHTSLPAKPGKPAYITPGKNVTWNEQQQTMYAATAGQISRTNRQVHVYPLYEVNQDITMKTGNLDFVGTIVVRGSIPNGYTLKAKGDIKVYGLVEGATLIAEGSVYISEGIAGGAKGSIQAGLDIHAGYINQGNVEAKRDICIDNSILHSNCIAGNDIHCDAGNIIGGSLSAGRYINCKDIGNKMSSKTEVFFGPNKLMVNQEKRLQEEKAQLEDSLHKLVLIGRKLQQKKDNVGQLSAKERITALRQRSSLDYTEKQLMIVKQEWAALQTKFQEELEAALCVEGTLYPNTYVSFGKYKRLMQQVFHYVKVDMNQGEITVHSLNS